MKSYYIIEHDLFGVNIYKKDINPEDYENQLVELTDEELKTLIENYESQGLKVMKYHQEYKYRKLRNILD